MKEYWIQLPCFRAWTHRVIFFLLQCSSINLLLFLLFLAQLLHISVIFSFFVKCSQVWRTGTVLLWKIRVCILDTAISLREPLLSPCVFLHWSPHSAARFINLWSPSFLVLLWHLVNRVGKAASMHPYIHSR